MRSINKAKDLCGLDYRILFPRSYRGFHHFWADYSAWSRHYFTETLSIPDDKSLYIDAARALCLSCYSIKEKSSDNCSEAVRLVYVDKDGYSLEGGFHKNRKMFIFHHFLLIVYAQTKAPPTWRKRAAKKKSPLNLHTLILNPSRIELFNALCAVFVRPYDE